MLQPGLAYKAHGGELVFIVKMKVVGFEPPTPPPPQPKHGLFSRAPRQDGCEPGRGDGKAAGQRDGKAAGKEDKRGGQEPAGPGVGSATQTATGTAHHPPGAGTGTTTTIAAPPASTLQGAASNPSHLPAAGPSTPANPFLSQGSQGSAADLVGKGKVPAEGNQSRHTAEPTTSATKGNAVGKQEEDGDDMEVDD
jgi:hypothetical protein